MIEFVSDMLASPLIQRAFIVAVLVGLAAPVVGTYLVQRGLALLGDGIGHIALTGIALGWLAGAAANVTPHDAWAVPGAILISVLGAVMIEVIRANGRTRGDVALAILFYGGIAGGVILISVAGGTTTNLNYYLFGSISTVSVSDAWFTIALATLVLLVGLGLRGPLFALCHDEEFAHACGLPTSALNVLVAVVAALTVSVSMRVVGALLGGHDRAGGHRPARVALLRPHHVPGDGAGRGGLRVGSDDHLPGGGLSRRHDRGTPSGGLRRRRPRVRTAAARQPLATAPHHLRRQIMSASSTAQRPRATRQRAAVTDILARTDEFRSAQQIHAALEAEGTKVGLATVYRNLQTLAESGAVDQVRSAEGEVLYRACEEQEHHHHIVCRCCGYTVEVSGGGLEEWIQRVSARQGFTQMEHTAEFFGLCATCSAQDASQD